MLLGLSVFVGALIVLGGWSAWHLWRMSALSQRIIAENYDSVVAAQDMAMCRDDTLRLDKLVKELLELSRIESGETAPQLVALPPGDLVTGAVEPLHRQVDAKVSSCG